MHQEATFLRTRAPVWEPVPQPAPVPDAGTPLFDALARQWQSQGRYLPGTFEQPSQPGPPAFPSPRQAAPARTTSWWADPADPG